MDQETFKEYFEVRDSELDMGGIVNNANYLVYLEHARHKYVQTLGLSFSEYVKKGLNFVVVSYQLHYKHSLKSHDKFYITCQLVPHTSALKIVFQQEIHLVGSDKLILTAECVAACVNEHAKNKSEKFIVPEEIKKVMHSSQAHSVAH